MGGVGGEEVGGGEGGGWRLQRSYWQKAVVNKWVLSLDLNSGRVEGFLRPDGREFQTEGARKLKERSPNVLVLNIKYDILYTCRAQSYQNNLHKVLYGKTKVLYGKTNKQTHTLHTHTHTHTHDVLNREPEPHISSFSTVPVLHTQIRVLMPFEDLKLTELKVDIGQ